MRNDRRIRDAKIRNGRPTRQERLEIKRNCLACGNAEEEEDGITCLLHNWYFNTNVARVSSCTKYKKA